MSTLYHYKNPKTLTNQGTHNSPQHTLELWKVLIWLSDDIWLAPNRCSLLSLLFLLCDYCFERENVVWLTGDFSTSSIKNVEFWLIQNFYYSYNSKNKNSSKKFFIYWDLKPWLFDWLLKFEFFFFFLRRIKIWFGWRLSHY